MGGRNRAKQPAGMVRNTHLEPRLAINPEAHQAILDNVAQIDPRAKKVKPDDLVDRRYLDDMEKSGFFDKLWAEKR